MWQKLIPAYYISALQGGAALLAVFGLVFLIVGRSRLVFGFFPLAAVLPLWFWRIGQVGHLPLSGLHETLLTFGSSLTVASAISCLRFRRWRIYGVCLVGAGSLLFFSSLPPTAPTPIFPALQTIWFEIHVGSSFVAYSCFALGAAAALFRLFGSSDPETRRIVEGANRWGFAWFSWGMISGGVWAYLAWGAYWLWHVKELWSGVVWIYYGGAIHLPHMYKWRGKRQDALTLFGFFLVMCTYLGVGILMKNTHKF